MPVIEQLRVKLPNRPGTLAAMVAALAEARVDIKALEVAERGGGDVGEVNLIASDLDAARAALDRSGHDYRIEQAVAVEMDDRVGGLAAILEVLAREGLNVSQLYAFVTRVAGKSLALLSVDDPARADALLDASGFRTLSRQALEQSGERPSEERTQRTLGDHLGLDFIW